MAISVNNQNQLQQLANGACPVPATTPQVVLVTNQTDDCNTPVCPAPTAAPIFLNPDGLFSANQCELTFCLNNTGATAVPIIFGVGARKGEFLIDGRVEPSVVDNATVLSCDDYLSAAQLPAVNAPSIQFFNEFTADNGLVIGKVLVQINAAAEGGLALQARQNLRVVQFPVDLSADCKVSKIAPICLTSCGSGDFTPGNVSAQFSGPIVANRSNGFEYTLNAGSTISARLCITGKYQVSTIVPC